MSERDLIAIRSLAVEVLPAFERTRPVGDGEDLFERGLDSLGVAALLAGLESTLGIAVPLDRLNAENFSSIEAIAAVVAELRTAAGHGTDACVS